MKKMKTLTTLVVLCSALFTAPVLLAQKKLTDPEIASVAVTANKIDIGYAEMAKKTTKNEDVKKFAETMITDHNAVIKQATDLVTKLGVTPKDNDLSRKLAGDADKKKTELKGKSGAAFDKAYIDNEVAYHKAVIATVEGTLIPDSQNAELKQLLQNILPALKTHLEHAETVQRSLK